MSINYNKPGKTPPGTKHPRPELAAKRTWLDIVRPGPKPKHSKRIKPAESVSFTTAEPPKTALRRRARRDLGRLVGPDQSAFVGRLVTEERPRESLLNARKARRMHEAFRKKRQKKGQRIYDRRERLVEIERQQILVLLEVAQGYTSATPDCVRNAQLALKRRAEEMEAASVQPG